MKMRQDSRVAIEQAIARGCSNYYVMHAYGITYRTLAAIKDNMLDEAPQVQQWVPCSLRRAS